MESSGSVRPFVKSEELEWEAAEEGVRRKVLGHDSELMMVLVEFRNGAVGYVHTHPHRQITFVESGRFEVQIDGKKDVLKKGDSFIVEPGLPHGVAALEDGCLIDVFNPAREDFLKRKKP